MTAQSLTARLLAGQAQAVGRALSIVENDAHAARSLLDGLRDRLGRALTIGVTGPPGAGKSTLVDGLITVFRGQARSVGVLAVDPTSPYSGGAVLGDRIRMMGHTADPGVFVRSMATRGHVGGLARATGDAVQILDAAGFDVVIVETVGVGQDEIEIARLADATVVVLVPGTGDDIQSMKAGLMEIADVFVINKADREGADRLAASVEATLSLAADADWRPPVLKTIASTGAGVEALAATIDRFRGARADQIARRRRDRHPSASRATGSQAAVLDHVGMAAEDGEALGEILSGLTGLRLTPAEDLPVQRARVRFLESDGARMEVIEPLGPGSPLDRFLARRGTALHHLALRVPDLTVALAALRARGVRLIDDSPRPGADGRLVAFIHPASAGGILVELVGEDTANAVR